MQINNQLIEELIIEKLKSLNPLRIILFGSYAYGSPSPDSDLDICVVKRKVVSKTLEKKEIRERLKDIHYAKDILVPSMEEYEFYRNQPGSVYMDIDQKGKVLWTAAF